MSPAVTAARIIFHRLMEKTSLFSTFCFPAINNILETSAKNKKA